MSSEPLRAETVSTVDTTDACPECGGALARDDGRAEVACTECGLVVDADRVDHGPEWRSFEEDEGKGRVGAPLTQRVHDRGLSTTIGWRDADASGNAITGRQREQLRRLRKWNRRFQTRDAADRNLRHALGEIERMAAALGLPESTREVASTIYRRALEANLIKGHSIESMASASLYGAARQQHIPRSLDELETVSRVDRKRIQRSYRRVARQLGLEIEPADPRAYTKRFCSDLDLSSETERLAVDLLDAATAANFHSGKSPVSLAAAAVYAAARMTNESRTQQAVGEVAQVSEITIRARYQELVELYEEQA